MKCTPGQLRPSAFPEHPQGRSLSATALHELHTPSCSPLALQVWPQPVVCCTSMRASATSGATRRPRRDGECPKRSLERDKAQGSHRGLLPSADGFPHRLGPLYASARLLWLLLGLAVAGLLAHFLLPPSRPWVPVWPLWLLGAH